MSSETMREEGVELTGDTVATTVGAVLDILAFSGIFEETGQRMES
jgi:hypothetical protein